MCYLIVPSGFSSETFSGALQWGESFPEPLISLTFVSAASSRGRGGLKFTKRKGADERITHRGTIIMFLRVVKAEFKDFALVKVMLQWKNTPLEGMY